MDDKLVDLKPKDLETIVGGAWDYSMLEIGERSRLNSLYDYMIIYYQGNNEAKFWESYDKFHAYLDKLEEKYGPSGGGWDDFNTKYTR